MESLLAQAKKIEDFEKKQFEEEESMEIHDRNKKPGELTAEQKKKAGDLAMREYLSTGNVSQELREFMPKAKADKDDVQRINAELKALGINRAAQQSTSDSAGGYTIPEGFQAELDRGVKAFGGMFEASRVWRTATGNPVMWPNNNDTANKAYLLAEAGNAETSAVAATFGQQQFEAYKYTSGLIRISSELITDSAFNMPALIQELLSERIFRGLNDAFTTADGSSKPKGITIGASLGVHTEDDGLISADDLINLEHSVDPGYRNRPGTRLMFHDSVLKAIKKLSVSSTDLRPLWLPSFRDGAPATVLGYNYTINQDMASFVGANTSADDNKKIVLFGDLQKYIIRQVANSRIVRLNERFGDTDEVGFVVFVRYDGDLLDAGTHPVKWLRVSTT
jgi:HK97 family phage major capsid protein